MPNCAHGERKSVTGTKNGQSWSGWFCPTPKGTPGQCPPEWVPKEETAVSAPAAPRYSEGTELLREIRDELALMFAWMKLNLKPDYEPPTVEKPFPGTATVNAGEADLRVDEIPFKSVMSRT